MIKTTVLDFYVAKLTPPTGEASTPTYGTPEKACGSAKVAVAYNKSPTKIYESGRAIYNKTNVADAKVTLDTHSMTLDRKMELFYSLPEGDEYEEGADSDTPQNVAIGWSALLSDGRYYCTWFYDASAEPNDETYNTSNESGPQIEAEQIAFSCVKRAGDRKLRRTKICTDETARQAFFASVTPST